MSKFECEIPETGRTESGTMVVPLHGIIPELKFPRKLENCTVRLWYGSEFRGQYNTGECQMWLLSDNVIKIEDGSYSWVVYNAVIVVEYDNYSKKD